MIGEEAPKLSDGILVCVNLNICMHSICIPIGISVNISIYSSRVFHTINIRKIDAVKYCMLCIILEGHRHLLS